MYKDRQKEIGLFAKIFGHPAIVAILQRLFEIDANYCGDLSEEIGLHNLPYLMFFSINKNCLHM